MARNLERSRIFLLASIFFILSGSYISASEASEQNSGGFYGLLKEVNCAQNELKANNLIGSKKGSEEVFVIGKDVKYRGAKDCQDLAPNRRVHIRYIENEGRKTITALDFRPAGQRSGKQASRSKIALGWLNSVDCGGGTLIMEDMGDRSKKEAFTFSKETVFETGGSKGCNELKKGFLVSFTYNETDSSKVIQKLKIAARDDK